MAFNWGCRASNQHPIPVNVTRTTQAVSGTLAPSRSWRSGWQQHRCNHPQSQTLKFQMLVGNTLVYWTGSGPCRRSFSLQGRSQHAEAVQSWCPASKGFAPSFESLHYWAAFVSHGSASPEECDDVINIAHVSIKWTQLECDPVRALVYVCVCACVCMGAIE